MNTQSIKKIIFAICALVLLGAVIYFLFPKQESQNQIACTMEAKLCPDGSYVGRIPPSCEFALCPELSTSGWKTINDSKTGYSFKYPEDLSTTYISLTDWPPQIAVMNEPFSCTEGGSEIARAGQTTKKNISGKDYCVTVESEGAAGSIYRQYAYATEFDGKTIIMTFSLRFVQCANYDEPQSSACETERTNFDIDTIISRVMSTIEKK